MGSAASVRGMDPVYLRSAQGHLGDARAKKMLERAMNIEVAETLTHVGSAYGHVGDASTQKQMIERALKILEDDYGPFHVEAAKACAYLGIAYGELGEAETKKQMLERASQIVESGLMASSASSQMIRITRHQQQALPPLLDELQRREYTNNLKVLGLVALCWNHGRIPQGDFATLLTNLGLEAAARRVRDLTSHSHPGIILVSWKRRRDEEDANGSSLVDIRAFVDMLLSTAVTREELRDAGTGQETAVPPVRTLSLAAMQQPTAPATNIDTAEESELFRKALVTGATQAAATIGVGTFVDMKGEDYVVHSHLGGGGFGNVYKVQQRGAEAGSACFAMKVGKHLSAAGLGMNCKELMAFTVEAVASTEAWQLAQDQVRWRGRVFLPMVHAIREAELCDGSCRQHPVLLMELADTSLDEAGRRFEGEELLLIAWALASTLALLNEAGFLHGDLKPSNVLWLQDVKSEEPQGSQGCGNAIIGGWPLLADFGSAQSFNGMMPTGVPLGPDVQVQTQGWTREFAAPEVEECGGKWGTVKTDMFSWARTLQRIRRPGPLSDSVPSVLEELLRQCLKADPSRRPESFGAIAAKLEEHLDEEKCLRWGRRLWQRQQAHFSSPSAALARCRAVADSGLQLLLTSREQLTTGSDSESEQIALAMICLATIKNKLGNVAESLSWFRKAVVMRPALLCKHFRLLHSIGKAYGQLGYASKQKQMLERALEMDEEHYGPSHVQVAITLADLGNAYSQLGDGIRQQQMLERALKIFEDNYGPWHVDVAKTLDNLGNAHVQLGHARMGEEMFQRALRIKKAYYGRSHIEVATTLANLGNAYSCFGDARTGEEMLQRALKIFKDYYGPSHVNLALPLVQLGVACGNFGDAASKRDALESALGMFRDRSGPSHNLVRRTLCWLFKAYCALGDATQALWTLNELRC